MACRKAYDDCQVLEDQLEELKSHPDPTTSVFNQLAETYRTEAKACLRAAVSVKTDSRVAPLLEALKAELTKLSISIFEATEAKGDKAKYSSTESRPTSSGAAPLNLDVPMFRGDPLEWKHFEHMFLAVIKTRASHLFELEKKCLLLKAMGTPQARSIVEDFQEDDTGYKKALETLHQAYGQAQVVYPILVKRMTTPDHYTYDQAGLQRLKDKVVRSSDSIQAVVGDSVSQFITHYVRQYFDKKLNEEWERHIAGSKDMPQ